MSQHAFDLRHTVIPGRRLLIREHRPESVTAGGIILPDVAQESLFLAEVVMLGTRVYPAKVSPDTNIMDIEVGDTVLCSRDSMRSSICSAAFGAGMHIVVWETEDGGDGDVLAVLKAKGLVSNVDRETDHPEA